MTTESGGPGVPTGDEIVTAVRSAGWLLEQEADAALRHSGFSTVMGFAFSDPDDPTVSREVDVMGYRQVYRNDDLAMSIGVRVIAECKASTMPYVLIGRAYSDDDAPRLEQLFRFSTVEVGEQATGDSSRYVFHVEAPTYLGLRDLANNPWDRGFVATQMTRLERKKSWVADNRGIFTGLVYPLAKALVSLRSKKLWRAGSVEHKPGQDWAGIEFYYPVVVTTAPIYALNVGEVPLDPTPVPWATMTRRIKSKSVDGTFFVDVVNADSVLDYLAEIGTFMDAVAEIAAADPGRFVANKDHEYNQRSQETNPS